MEGWKAQNSRDRKPFILETTDGHRHDADRWRGGAESSWWGWSFFASEHQERMLEDSNICVSEFWVSVCGWYVDTVRAGSRDEKWGTRTPTHTFIIFADARTLGVLHFFAWQPYKLLQKLWFAWKKVSTYHNSGVKKKKKLNSLCPTSRLPALYRCNDYLVRSSECWSGSCKPLVTSER